MKFKNIFSTVVSAFILLSPICNAEACTSAIISADLNPYGRPILWKHRDTSTTDNKVEYIPSDGVSQAYVALYNAADMGLNEAWMGMNESGFAVMNTASYNLKDDKVSNKKMDKEGFVMTKALRSCKTVDDFANLLDTLPRPMGVEANFGVIDAFGNGAYFETNNHSFIRFDLKDAPDGMLVRTNYSHAGRPKEGYGYVREANAECLLAPYAEKKAITSELLTEVISRTFYHDGFKKDFTMSGETALLDEDYIPRYKSTATIAIEGCMPLQAEEKVNPDILKDQYIMWTGIGYPPVAEIRAVRCTPDGVDPDLKGNRVNGHSHLGDVAKAKRAQVFSSKGKKKYINLPLLYNESGTGYAQKAIEKNHKIYKEEIERRDNSANVSPDEL
ncbi:MAG: C45 family peptidase [Muribaculaceae bacterium]|nr:C45 family peptidase [Muribaculaceae bacterium]